MNQQNKDLNCYTKGNCMFSPNFGMPPQPFYSRFNIPTGIQTGVPMFPLYGYDNSEDYDRDVSYMKQLYPRAVYQIQKEVDEECDKLEYDGSCMFDECPDKNHLNMIVDTIYERVSAIDSDPFVLEAEELQTTQRPFLPPYYPCDPRDRYCPHPRADYRDDGHPDWLRALIGILLFNEVTNRRRRYRSRKRWF